MEINFKGKRALVTGATKGIGHEIALKLSQCGAKVVAVGRSKQLLGIFPYTKLIKILVETLKAEQNSIEIVELDVANWKQTENVLNNIGPIDLLVNNAGFGWLKPMSEIVEQDFDDVFGVNTKAVINVTRIVVKNLQARKQSGSIVNISSLASLAGILHHTVYSASKGAVDAFTRAAALECGPDNICVNAVNPTVIMTDMGRKGWSDPKVAKPMLDKIPLHRFGEVEEVVNAVLFLLSDQSSMINGTCLPIDGGFSAC